MCSFGFLRFISNQLNQLQYVMRNKYAKPHKANVIRISTASLIIACLIYNFLYNNGRNTVVQCLFQHFAECLNAAAADKSGTSTAICRVSVSKRLLS